MFYDIIKSLCKANGTNVTRLIGELGLSSGNLSGWKNGTIPKSDTVKKIADYFGVTSDYLLGIENVSDSDTKKIRSPEDERILNLMKSDDNLTHYVNSIIDLSPDQRKKVVEYAHFLKSQEKKAPQK